jgi:ADP-heptose:LPS heptosyltransferase
MQEVVDGLKGFNLVQAGSKNEARLQGVNPMQGTTTLRQLFSLVYHARGVICGASLPLHLAAAFGKPCVCVTSAINPISRFWYPRTTFVYRPMPCEGCYCQYLRQCTKLDNKQPRCTALIEPHEVIAAVKHFEECF